MLSLSAHMYIQERILGLINLKWSPSLDKKSPSATKQSV